VSGLLASPVINSA